jgi:hypothetical protein
VAVIVHVNQKGQLAARDVGGDGNAFRVQRSKGGLYAHDGTQGPLAGSPFDGPSGLSGIEDSARLDNINPGTPLVLPAV